MNFKIVGKILGGILCVEALFMLPALLISAYYGNARTAIAFAISFLLTGAAGMITYKKCRNAGSVFYVQEGMIATGLTWLFMSVFGAMPFLISGEISGFTDALFETVSGFTTTGASVVAAPEALSRGILYWRSFTHWLGGMGILVFLLAVLPKSAEGSALHLLRAESPGPSVDKITIRMRSSVRILYVIYFGLTLLNIIMLLAGGMPVFEAVCHALGTAGTGGFGVKNDSYMSYSPYLQNVTTVFMILFGVNFSIYFLLLKKDFKSILKDEELRLYLIILTVAAVFITFNIRNNYTGIGEALRHAAFQVASISSSTGFASTDFESWPDTSKIVLLCLMFSGACAGSTGGGMKVIRPIMLCKQLRRSVRKMLRPRLVEKIRMNGQPVAEETLNSLNAYLAAYCALIIASVIAVSLDGKSIVTTVSAVITCFNNIGPGLEACGPTSNFAGFGLASKWVLMFDMLLGRLEIFPVLVLFSRHTWSRTK